MIKTRKTGASNRPGRHLIPFSTSATTRPRTILVSGLHPAQRTYSPAVTALGLIKDLPATLRYENTLRRRLVSRHSPWGVQRFGQPAA